MAPRAALSRVAERPDPAQWHEKELLTLAETVKLFFPNGPLTVGGLRSAIARGELASVGICGRIYTTPGAVRRLTALGTVDAPAVPPDDALVARARALRRSAT